MIYDLKIRFSNSSCSCLLFFFSFPERRERERRLHLIYLSFKEEAPFPSPIYNQIFIVTNRFKGSEEGESLLTSSSSFSFGASPLKEFPREFESCFLPLLCLTSISLPFLSCLQAFLFHLKSIFASLAFPPASFLNSISSLSRHTLTLTHTVFHLKGAKYLKGGDGFPFFLK